MEGYLSEYLPIAIFMALAIGLFIAFIVGAVVVGSQNLILKSSPLMNVALMPLMILASRLMYGFIWSLFCLLSLIWKLPFYSHGPLRSVILAPLGSGQ